MYIIKMLLGGSMSMTMLFTIVSAGSLQDTMTSWEQRTSVDQGLIEKGALIDTALTILDRSCNVTSAMQSQIGENINTIVTDIGLTLNHDTAPQYYKAYQQRHDAASSYQVLSEYCIYKIAAYKLQQYFYLVYQGKTKPINSVRSDYSYRIKYFAALQQLIDAYPVQNTISKYIKTSVANRANVLKMHSITKKTSGQLGILYRNILMFSLVHLKNDMILTQSDIEVIGSKVSLNYVEQCNELRGITKVILSYNTMGRILSTTLNNITLNVNVCEDLLYLNDFDTHIKDLIYHELAHYVYYVKDTTHDTFESICRSSGKNICKKSDFVSDYAQTAAEEDYAESFQYWYQSKKIKKPTAKLTKKYQYFDALFKSTQSNIGLSNSKS